MTNPLLKSVLTYQFNLKACNLCPEMYCSPVTGEPVVSKVMLVGQAPGFKEIEVHKPFAWTAGKTLFKWFERIGVSEDQFRHSIYMAAVCRCYPGKKLHGGDRVPDKVEIECCSDWLKKRN